LSNLRIYLGGFFLYGDGPRTTVHRWRPTDILCPVRFIVRWCAPGNEGSTEEGTWRS